MDDIVQPETVQEGTESTTEEKPQEIQPLTEERIQQLIAEETEKVRRQLQSDKDRAIAEVRREAEKRVRLAEGRAGAYETSFDGLDEDTRKDAELAMLRSERKSTQELAQEEAQRRNQEEYAQRLQSSLAEHVKSLGITQEDKRIDWATDAPDYLTGRSRFDASIAKILQADRKTTEDKQKQDFKDLESKLRKDLGLDTVEPSAGAGVGRTSDNDFLDKYGKGELPDSKENRDRAIKLMK